MDRLEERYAELQPMIVKIIKANPSYGYLRILVLNQNGQASFGMLNILPNNHKMRLKR